MPLRVGDLERIGGSDALPVWRKELNFERVPNGQNSWLEVLKGLELSAPVSLPSHRLSLPLPRVNFQVIAKRHGLAQFFQAELRPRGPDRTFARLQL